MKKIAMEENLANSVSKCLPTAKFKFYLNVIECCELYLLAHIVCSNGLKMDYDVDHYSYDPIFLNLF